MSRKFKIVCMVGSMKFYDVMLQEETRLTDMGYIVLHPVKSGYKTKDISDNLKKQYDDEIRAKIDMADIVYVIDVNGYVGKSTKSEMDYADNARKKVIRYSDRFNEFTEITDELLDISRMICDGAVTLIGSVRFKDMFNDVYRTLSRLGFTVYMPAIFSFTSDEICGFTDKQHRMFDELHEHKINMSKYVICVDGINHSERHVGEDTKREIEFIQRLPMGLAPTLYYTSSNGIAGVINDAIIKASQNTDTSMKLICNDKPTALTV